jgi:hypothetical protein
MTSLRHLFVHGIRFDTEVQYQVTRNGESSGHRYCNLPLRLALDLPADDGGVMSVIQCAAVLGQRHARTIVSLEYQECCTPVEMLRLIKECLPNSFCEAIDSPAPRELDFFVLHAMCQGGMGLVQWECEAPSPSHSQSQPSVTRWSVVMGAELDAHAKQKEPMLRALLLLDSNGSEPWACGYNARLELTHFKPGSDGLLTCRHLTGEGASVRMRCLIRVMPGIATDKTAVMQAA